MTTFACPISSLARTTSSHPHKWASKCSDAARPQRPRSIRLSQLRNGETSHVHAGICAIHAYSRWRRFAKTIIAPLASVCAILMSGFAYAHGRPVNRDKWEGLTSVFVNSAKPLAPGILADPPAFLFFIASMLFTSLAYTYHSINRGDAFQNTILAWGIVLGLLTAWSMDLGVLLGVFGLEQWFLLLSLVLSDIFHLIFVRSQRCEECETDWDCGAEKA